MSLSQYRLYSKTLFQSFCCCGWARSVAEHLPSVHEALIQSLAFRGGVLIQQAFESQLAKERSMSRVM